MEKIRLFGEKQVRSIHAVSATKIGDYKIRIAFVDDTTQEIDFKPLLPSALHPDHRFIQEPACEKLIP